MRSELEKFSMRVLEAAKAPQAYTFGNKAYIVSVYDVYSRRFGEMSREEFNNKLVEAHRAGELRLARADLVPNMDKRLIEWSEITYENARFHFIDLTYDNYDFSEEEPDTNDAKLVTTLHKNLE